MSGALRISPSGPIVQNGSGGQFKPSNGARLRLVEATTTVSGTSVIPTAPTPISSSLGTLPGLTVALSKPDKNLSYRARIECDVVNPSTNVVGEVELYIETSTDGGVTWVEQSSNTHVANSTEVAPAVPTGRAIALTLPLTPGVGLGLTGTEQTLVVRAKIGASSGGGVLVLSSAATPGGDLKSQGTILLQLEECL